MDAVKILSVLLIFGPLAVVSSDGREWGEEIGRVWRDWREQPVFVKRCSLLESLGFCPRKDPKVCILDHPLITEKMCAFCSVTTWFAYREDICPGDVLSKLAKETGNHYYRHEDKPRPTTAAEKEDLLELREYQLVQELKYPGGETFESGSGEMPVESSETSFTPYSPETQIEANENEGSLPEESGLAALIDQLREVKKSHPVVKGVKKVIRGLRGLFF